jgi:hypothetical protein
VIYDNLVTPRDFSQEANQSRTLINCLPSCYMPHIDVQVKSQSKIMRGRGKRSNTIIQNRITYSVHPKVSVDFGLFKLSHFFSKKYLKFG